MLKLTLNFPIDTNEYLNSTGYYNQKKDIADEEEIIVGDIVAYDDGILAVVLDMLGDSLYLFNENGCVEKIKKDDVVPTCECTDLVDMMMLKLQNTEV